MGEGYELTHTNTHTHAHTPYTPLDTMSKKITCSHFRLHLRYVLTHTWVTPITHEGSQYEHLTCPHPHQDMLHCASLQEKVFNVRRSG